MRESLFYFSLFLFIGVFYIYVFKYKPKIVAKFPSVENYDKN